jgi:hypothetical protein
MFSTGEKLGWKSKDLQKDALTWQATNGDLFPAPKN